MATQNNIVIKQLNECKLNDLSNNLADLSENLYDLLNDEIETNIINVKEINRLKLKLREIENNGVAITTEPYNNIDTQLNQCKYDVVDEYHSKHYYDKNGPNSENLQYLQLDSTTNIPSSLAGTMNNCYYEDSTGSYMYGVSTQSLYYNTTIYGPGDLSANNFNRLTKREMFNLLQDTTVLDASSNVLDTSYNTFVSIWGHPRIKQPTYDGWYSAQTQNIQTFAGADTFWNWGTHMSIWRYDIKNKTVISRQSASILKELDVTNTGSWKTATGGRGPISSFGDGKFVVTTTNPTISSILVFDKDLKAVAVNNVSSYGVLTVQDPQNIPVTDYQSRSLYSCGINTDQINSAFVKKWNRSDLSGNTYTSVFDKNKVIDVFNTDITNQAVFIYINYSSQGQYDAVERASSFGITGTLNGLTDAKWNASKGKIVMYSLYKDVLNNNKWTITPVRAFLTGPDDYVAGDKLRIESFVKCPDKNDYDAISVFYPLIDNSSNVIDLNGYESFRTNAWNEGFNKFKFSDGSNNTLPISAGVQKFAVNIYDVSGSNQYGSYSCVYYQDVYTVSYRKFVDNLSNVYYKQDRLGNGIGANGINNITIQLSDEFCSYYPGDGLMNTLTRRRYVDLSTNVIYYIDASGNYRDSNNNIDPSSIKDIRKQILNGGFMKRYMFAPYQLDPSGNGLTSYSGFMDCSSNKGLTPPVANPIQPPYLNGEQNRNPGQKHIIVDFDFSNNEVFDATKYYISKPFSLMWEDTREFAGGYVSSGGTINTNKGTKKLLDYNRVKEFFRLCQSNQGTDASLHDVQLIVVTDGNGTYVDNANNTYTLDNTTIAFKVRGAVLANQPMVLKINPSAVDNLTLTPFLAKQLNFYGGGIYGKVSMMQDENNQYHLFTGVANGNYGPLSDLLIPAEYATRKMISEIRKLLDTSANDVDLPISRETAILLGFNNMNNTPQEGRIRGFKTRIVDISGRELLDCTLRGIADFYFKFACYANNYYCDQKSNYILSNGETRLINNDVTGACFYSYPLTGPSGTKIQLSGKQFRECFYLMSKLHEFRSRVFSKRSRRFVVNRSCCINPKTLELEHAISGVTSDVEIYHSYARNFHKLLVDDEWADQGQNRDEVQGIVTAGSKFIASAGKSQLRIFEKSKVSGKKAVLINYKDPNNNDRPNFALESEGLLGRNVLSNGTFTYGNNDYYIGYQNYSQIAGGMTYVGKINGRDMFVNSAAGFMYCDNAESKAATPIIPIDKDVKYNNFENILNATKSEDGDVWILPRRAGANLYTGLTVGLVETNRNVEKPQSYKLIYGFSGDENSKVKIVWITVVESKFPFDLSKFSSTSDWGATAGGSNNGISVVNDLIFVPCMAELCVLKASTGEILAKYNANDFDYDEFNVPGRATNYDGTQNDLQCFGSVQYGAGNLHVYPGYRRIGNNSGAYTRKLWALNLKVNNKFSLALNKLDISGSGIPNRKNNNTALNTGRSNLSGSLDIVFNPNDTVNYNNNNFVLLTTFLTRDRFTKTLSNYYASDLEFDALYHGGITAIAIKTTDPILNYFNKATNINDKFVNGGSWYGANNISFNQLVSSTSVLFLYAGQIPTSVIKQTPYIINDNQIREASMVRNQKRLLVEYYRQKNNFISTYPYPDNGFFIGQANLTLHNTIKFQKYWLSSDNSISAYNTNFNPYNTSNGQNPGNSQIWHQSLGYTDIGGPNGLNSRPFNTPF